MADKKVVETPSSGEASLERDREKLTQLSKDHDKALDRLAGLRGVVRELVEVRDQAHHAGDLRLDSSQVASLRVREDALVLKLLELIGGV